MSNNQYNKNKMELKEIIKQIFDDGDDGISFLPIRADFSELDVKGFTYDKKSKYEKYDIGNKYHIFLYKCNEDGQVTHIDYFDAILTDPRIYTMHIINCDFYGVIAKKTKTSSKIIKSIYNKIKPYYVC